MMLITDIEYECAKDTCTIPYILVLTYFGAGRHVPHLIGGHPRFDPIQCASDNVGYCYET